MQLEVGISKVVEEQTISVYQSSHSGPRTLLGRRMREEHTCMELTKRLEAMLMAHFLFSITTMSDVQYAMLQHEKLLS